MTSSQRSFWRRNRWLLWTAGSLLVVLAGAAIAVAVLARRVEPFLRARIVETLSEHFHARVELDSFHIALGNGLRGEWGVWADGRGLRIWPPVEVAGVVAPGAAQPQVPLIKLDEFRFHAPLRYQPGTPVHLSEVRLRGLDIHVPPRTHFQHGGANAGVVTGAPHPGATGQLVGFRVDSINCDGAHLELGTSKPGKLPLAFAIARLKLTGITPSGAMNFDAQLTNPRPRGEIHATGSFGPWQVADPGESPVAGDYTFDHADLSNFKGIAGILSSTGHYQGTLRDIVVDGQTDTPDFRLSHSGNAMALHTRFHAKVDGTNGDTWLDTVDATLGGTHLRTQGQVVRVLAADAKGPPHMIGHDIALTVNVDRGRIADFMRLTSNSPEPLLTGTLTMKTTLHIPPGTAPVHQRMALDGQFALEQAQFTSAAIQDRIMELSLRGQGRPGDVKNSDSAGIQSRMQSSFKMEGGVLTLPDLNYTVPGADIQLKGTYSLDGGVLNFIGVARTQATVSKMVGGWKGFLLKPADGLFKKGGTGALIPIHIGGTRKNPEFGVDLKRMKTTTPERPGSPQ